MRPARRTVSAEILDGLADTDPAAIRSRRDLRRIHRVMGTRGIVVRALHACGAPRREGLSLRVLELGAGDGSLMLGVARAMRGQWPPVNLVFLDRAQLIDAATIASYAEVGWTAESVVMDVMKWAAHLSDPLLQRTSWTRWDLIVANLFLHHFADKELALLLEAIALRTERFFACEPRRGWLALGGSHLVCALGATAVTRMDAVSSVHAGFRDREITTLWPGNAPSASINEYSAGLFSHCFYAERSPSASLPDH